MHAKKTKTLCVQVIWEPYLYDSAKIITHTVRSCFIPIRTNLYFGEGYIRIPVCYNGTNHLRPHGTTCNFSYLPSLSNNLPRDFEDGNLEFYCTEDDEKQSACAVQVSIHNDRFLLQNMK